MQKNYKQKILCKSYNKRIKGEKNMLFKQGKNVLIVGKISKVQAKTVVEVKGVPKNVVSFSINCGKGENGTIWLNAELWGEQALNPMIKRGAVGLFAGELKTKKWDGKDGKEVVKNFVALTICDIKFCPPDDEQDEKTELVADIQDTPVDMGESDLPF